MTEIDARAILTWKYDGPYAFYDIDVDDPDIALPEMLDGSHWAVEDEAGELVGFFAVGDVAQVDGGHRSGAYERYPGLDIGLGMRPDRTGQGFGLPFLNACLDFAHRELGAGAVRLSVATFNRRAIRVYERAGFRRGPEFQSKTPSGETEFRLMTLTR